MARILDAPAHITVFLERDAPAPADALTRQTEDRWHGNACAVVLHRTGGALTLTLEASAAVERVRVRWATPLPAARLRVLGDAWERSYGDLGWRDVVPERSLPWYFLTFDGQVTHGYGVMTGAAAFAFWQCDPYGVSLWLDVRNGGSGVRLSDRQLTMATIVRHTGSSGESPMAVARALCRKMCPLPRASVGPIYGSNDWYYAYGNSSAENILRDADLVAELSPATGPRPFTVADDGWRNAKTFPDMAGLADGIRSRGVRPGIWIRPLEAVPADTSLLLPSKRFPAERERQQNASFDPTIPEALDRALAKVRQVRAWGYDLIKHDFSTYDLLGQWGNAMDASPALAGWGFHDRTRTSAEIIRDLYHAIRQASGNAVVIGCNTVGHLAAGIFDGQRIGDDVSGKLWERTRRMGVNALAFRLPQHGTFFSADPGLHPDHCGRAVVSHPAVAGSARAQWCSRRHLAGDGAW